MDFQDIMEGGIIQECCRNHAISSDGGAIMTHRILVSSILYKTVTERAGQLGLEQHTAIDHVEEYM
eukprot:14747562-Ditylum_brightwellii.AAC.1